MKQKIKDAPRRVERPVLYGSYMDTLRDYERKLEKKNDRKIKQFSITKSKLDEDHIDHDFISKIQRLSLEEMIALKLESMGSLTNGKLYFPINRLLFIAIQRTIVLFALSLTTNMTDAATLLGITKLEIERLIKKYGIEYEEREEFKRQNSGHDGERIEDEKEELERL